MRLWSYFFVFSIPLQTYPTDVSDARVYYFERRRLSAQGESTPTHVFGDHCTVQLIEYQDGNQ